MTQMHTTWTGLESRLVRTTSAIGWSLKAAETNVDGEDNDIYAEAVTTKEEDIIGLGQSTKKWQGSGGVDTQIGPKPI
jgi:hypothetical protein